MKKVILIIVLIVILAAAAAVAIPLIQLNSAMDVDNVTVEVPEGAGSTQIGQILADNGVIKNQFVFKLYLKLNDGGTALKAGTYTFNGSYTVADVVAQLMEGSAPSGIRVTIPEGYTAAQTAARLAENGVLTEAEFYDACANGDYEYDYLPAKGDRNRLEGYLWPETYFFDENDEPTEIIHMMLAEFDKNLTAEWRGAIESNGRTIHDVVIMASIIEREAEVSEDRPIISGVFYNRLEKGMMLQSCATVQYALGEVKPVLTYADLEIDSPYNTYANLGLPPGPICSPGAEALKAAVYPADTNYLYFVAKGDGSHVFSETFAQHEQAIQSIKDGKIQ